MKVTRKFQRLKEISGQTMTEYALILAAIAAVVVSLYNTSGILVSGLINKVLAALS